MTVNFHPSFAPGVSRTPCLSGSKGTASPSRCSTLNTGCTPRLWTSPIVCSMRDDFEPGSASLSGRLRTAYLLYSYLSRASATGGRIATRQKLLSRSFNHLFAIQVFDPNRSELFRRFEHKSSSCARCCQYREG